MRRSPRIKQPIVHVPLRKAVLSASAAARHGFPAWVEGDERGVALPVTIVTPRVRDALVLRHVPNPKPGRSRTEKHAHGAQ